jgi:glycosyltransferase involved in cell wall biosynthesis
MALGTPIVAFGSSAIGWTVGDAGIVWSEPDPHLVATSIVRLHTDLMLREMLRELGRARYRAVFAPDAHAKTLEAAVARLAA